MLDRRHSMVERLSRSWASISQRHERRGKVHSMQALKTQKKAVKNSDNFPFVHYYDDHNILCRDGMLLLLQAGCVDPDEYSFERLGRLKDEFAEFIKNNLGTDVVLYQHVMRRRCDELPADRFVNPVAARIDDEYRHMLYQSGWKDQVVYGLYAPFAIDRKVKPAEVHLRKAKRLSELAAKFRAQLPEFKFRAIPNQQGEYSPTLAFLMSFCGFGDVPQPRFSPFHSISMILGRHSIYTKNTLFQQTDERGQQTFGKIVSIKGYPASTNATIFDALRGVACQYNITQIFQPINTDVALERYDVMLKRRLNMEDVAETLNVQIQDAREQLASGEISMGRPAFFIAVQSESLEGLDAAVHQVVTELARVGIAAQIKDWWNLDVALYGMCPGNTHLVHAPENISNRNFAGFAMPLARGFRKAQGYTWGQALTTVRTLAGTLTPFSWHELGDDLGNTVITGDSGSGKTTFANFMIAQSTRAGSKTYYLDKDKGAKIPLLALGGQYYEIRAGQPFVNPLMLALNDDNKGFIKRFLQVLAGECSAQDIEVINTVVNQLGEYPKQERTLSRIAPYIKSQGSGDNSLYLKLKRWFGSGEYAWLFDHAVEYDFSNDITGIDITHALQNDSITRPVVFVAFHLFEQLLDGTPVQIVIDEGWQALDDELTSYKIKDADKTIRKKNGVLVFLTQDPDDIVNSDIYAAIKNQTKTFVTFPKPDASELHTKLGFREEDIERLRQLPDNKHLFAYRQGSRTGIAQLDLRDCPYTLQTVACNTRKLNIAEPLIKQYPQDWFEHYLKTEESL